VPVIDACNGSEYSELAVSTRLRRSNMSFDRPFPL
jgi:hypothetical protein